MYDLLPPPALLPHGPGAYIALLLAGFLIGIGGHLFKVRWLVAAGITLIAIGALLLPFAGGIPGERGSPSEGSVGAELGE